MSFSKQRKCAVCWVCIHYGTKEFRSTAWASGQSDWKHFIGRWEKHTGGHTVRNSHNIAVAKYNGAIQANFCGAVIDQVQPNYVIDEPKARKAAIIKMDITRTLAVLDFSFRGHDESEHSNNKGGFLEVQNIIARHSDEAKAAFDLPRNRTWNSSDIQNEMIQVIADETLLKILSKAKDAVYWSFGADGAQDRRKKEHLSICIRFVSENEGKFEVEEHFVGYVEPKGLSAIDLKDALSKKLLEFQTMCGGLESDKCVGQAYDGAAVNRGRVGGLHILMKTIFPNAKFTWCWAHRLQLVCVASASDVPHIGDFFDVVNQLATFFTGPVRHACLEQIQKELQVDEGIRELVHAGETRWLSHYDSIRRIIALMPSILQSLKTLGETRSSQDGTMAFGLLHRIQNFKFIFLLKTFSTLLAPFKEISLQLQAKDVDLAEAFSFIEILKKDLVLKAEDFSVVWESAAKMCRDLGMDVPLRPSRVRHQFRLPNFDSTSTEASGFRPTLNSSDDFQGNLYLPLVHCLTSELNMRFDQESLKQMETIAICFPQSTDFLNFEKLEELCNKFGLDSTTLKDGELGMAKIVLTEQHAKKPLTSLCELLYES